MSRKGKSYFYLSKRCNYKSIGQSTRKIIK